MANTTDARFKKCEQRIENALLEMLAAKPLMDIGVSELSRAARVSRATFYAHYENVVDVFDCLVQQAMADVQTFGERFSCGVGCKGSNKPTYCERVRPNSELSAVIRDPRFFPTMMALLQDDPDAATDAAEAGIPKSAARAIRLFQMSGCHAVATSSLAQQDDWEQTRAVIDRFIEGGMKAVAEMRPVR